MSKANVAYVLQHNTKIISSKVHELPNCISPNRYFYDEQSRQVMRKKYGIEREKILFLYGGNLGRPQDIPFVIECLKHNSYRKDCMFAICGNGMDYDLVHKYIKEDKPKNVILIPWLQKDEYDNFVKACDIGLIFLDHRFTIPNFPSRLLSYMEEALPVLACTDSSSDIGEIITREEFGWWCESDDVNKFSRMVEFICNNKSVLPIKGKQARKYLEDNYTTRIAYNIIEMWYGK